MAAILTLGGYPFITKVCRLAEFILRDMEAILGEWEAFAATLLPAAARMTPLALRDHAKQILEAVAKDLVNPPDEASSGRQIQGESPEIDGSPGNSGRDARRPAGAKRLRHQPTGRRVPRPARQRPRLWMDACPPDDPNLEDVIRFNEAIDQAIAESIGFFSAQVDQARNLLLGMLGHDMRSPLNTILTTASYLAALNAGAKVSEAASRLIRGGAP